MAIGEIGYRRLAKNKVWKYLLSTIELLGSRCSFPSKGSIDGDVEADDAELEEIEGVRAWRFRRQSVEEAAELNVITDADWSEDKRSRKSTSGGAAMREKRYLWTWSTTQALSTAEAELYATVVGVLRMNELSRWSWAWRAVTT